MMILIKSNELTRTALNRNCHERTLVMHSNLACFLITQSPEEKSRCNKDTCSNSSSLKFTQTLRLAWAPGSFPLFDHNIIAL